MNQVVGGKNRAWIRGRAGPKAVVLAGAVGLWFGVQAQDALALDFQSFPGDGADSCGAGTAIATIKNIEKNPAEACGALGTWDIVRLAGGGSMDGPGYGCGYRSVDDRGLGGTLCKARTEIEEPAAPKAFQRFDGDGRANCGEGTVLATVTNVRNNLLEACTALQTWDIARLAGGGSMDGPGYGCGFRASDERPLGNSLCRLDKSLVADPIPDAGDPAQPEVGDGGADNPGVVVGDDGELVPADPEPEGLAGMTAAHNEWRAVVNVAPVGWSSTVAALAQTYADELATTCSLSHARNRPGILVRFGGAVETDCAAPVDGLCPCIPGDATPSGTFCVGDGENLALGSLPVNAVDSWGEEKRDYNAAAHTCDGTGFDDHWALLRQGHKACGHYTQVVWENTKQIGCGTARCASGTPVTVCRYRPAGNFGNARPYQADPNVTFQVDLQARRDTFIDNTASTTNEGANNRMSLTNTRRGVIGFSSAASTLGDHLTDAQLRLRLASVTGGGGEVSAYPLPQPPGFGIDWVEGNGKTTGVPAAAQTAGTGEGATWDCARDRNLADPTNNCNYVGTSWEGGSGGQVNYGDPTGPAQAHTNGQTGRVSYDVTADAKSGSSAWFMKKVTETGTGKVAYWARESGRTGRVPLLRLQITGND